MLSAIQDKSVLLLETIVQKLEQNEQLSKRPRFIAKDEDQDKLLSLGYELIDIALYTSQLGLEASAAAYLSMQERIAGLEKQVKDGSVQLYKFLSANVYSPLESNLYVIYDKSAHMLSFLMEVLLENQQRIKDYLGKHYDSVTVLIRDNWMRLDFNRDGQVTLEDIKAGAQELLEFLRKFESKAHEIKSTLYQEAINYMQSDLGATAEETKRPDEDEFK